MSNSSCGENKVTKEKDPCRKSVCISDSCWIERPRFFNGQLLTDADLKAEQNYVIEKNKLHNRYLHGWGVVSGLKVKCYPCCEGYGSSGKVLIEPGYAIDCCGNDIVVCEEQEFDVVKRINQLKQKQKEESSPCGSLTSVQESSTANIEEKYYLTLTYKEEDAKPATALRADDPCSIQRCVPSRTKECFELDLVKFCTLEPTPEEDFVARLWRCLELFNETWNRVINADGKRPFSRENFLSLSDDDMKTLIKEYYKVLTARVQCNFLNKLDELYVSEETCGFAVDRSKGSNMVNSLNNGNKDEIIGFLKTSINMNCAFQLTEDAHISSVDIQAKYLIIEDGNLSYKLEWEFIQTEYKFKVLKMTKAGNLGTLILDILKDCICQALLIPCPTCNEDNVVILATITVKNNKIDKICNLARKYVLTSHSFNYWITPFLNLWVQGLFQKVSLANEVKINSINDLLKLYCCDLDIPQKQNLSLDFLNLFKNNFGIKKMMEQNFSELLSNISKNFMGLFDLQKTVKVEEKAKEEAAAEVTALKKEMEKMNEKMAAMTKELAEIKKKPETAKTTPTKPK